jgi:hypothetical protein
MVSSFEPAIRAICSARLERGAILRCGGSARIVEIAETDYGIFRADGAAISSVISADYGAPS